MYFQDIIITLHNYWNHHGCVLLEPYDIEMGAGTSHPSTALYAMKRPVWNVAYVQPCRRPTDSRYGQNPNRAQFFHQYQVILKPSPDDIQELCLQSLHKIGIDSKLHDIRFVEDDWQNPTIGAWGLGWEVWCDGMEVLQFTYMQQLGGIECKPVIGELTYGLERLAIFIQDVDNIWNIKWNAHILYKDIYMQQEQEHSKYNLEIADISWLKEQFHSYKQQGENLLNDNLTLIAYEYCMKTAHIFNILEARSAISVTQRVSYIAQIRELAKNCCLTYLNN